MASKPTDPINLIHISKDAGSSSLMIQTDGTLSESLIMQIIMMSPEMNALISSAENCNLIKIDNGHFRLEVQEQIQVAV